MKKHIHALWAFFILFSQSIAASVEVRSTHMTTGDGVANNSIRYIYQDSKGFIWMGTLNGLSRYDGNSFVTYRPEGGNKISLIDHRIRDLEEDKNGFLWIATSAELFYFHFSIQKLHTSFQKFNSDFIFGVMQKDVQLILMHNTLQV